MQQFRHMPYMQMTSSVIILTISEYVRPFYQCPTIYLVLLFETDPNLYCPVAEYGFDMRTHL